MSPHLESVLQKSFDWPKLKLFLNPSRGTVKEQQNIKVNPHIPDLHQKRVLALRAVGGTGLKNLTELEMKVND